MGHVLLRREGAAQRHPRAEQPEIRLGNMYSLHLLGDVSREVYSLAAEVVRGHILHHAGLRLPHVELGDRSSLEIAVARGRAELDDPVRLRIRERLQQNRVHHGENRGIGADAQRKRSENREGECRAFPEHADGVADVGEQGGQGRTSFREAARTPLDDCTRCGVRGYANNEKTDPGKGSVSP